MKKLVISLLITFVSCLQSFSQIDSIKVLTDNSQDGVKAIVYTTFNGCFKYDSLKVTNYADTSKTVDLYYTEKFPQCDCRCTKADTVSIGIITIRPQRVKFKNDIFLMESFIYVFDKTVSIDYQKKSNVNVFPNPIADKLMIQSDGMTNLNVNIYNSLGISILKKELNNNYNTDFDFSQYSSGIYFISINNITYKLIKQ